MRRADWFFVVALLLLATGLRFTGITFGQPDPVRHPSTVDQQMLPMETVLHPDEFLFVALPLDMLLRDQLTPRFFHNPSFLINLNLVTFWLTGADDGLSWADRDGTNQRQHAPFHLYVIGRVYSALGGVLAVAATYATARQMAGRYAALIAGLLVAVSLPLVQHAHYATTSSLAAGFAAVAVWASFAALESRRPMLVLAGVAAGLAAGSRYNAAGVGLIVLLVGLMLVYRRRDRQALVTVLAAWVALPITFLLTTPALLADVGYFISEIQYITGQYLGGTDVQFPISQNEGLLLLYRYGLVIGLGVVGSLLAVVGMIVPLTQKPRTNPTPKPPPRTQGGGFLRGQVVLLVVYIAAYSVVNLRVVKPDLADQMLVPVLPQWALLAGVGAAVVIFSPHPPAPSPSGRRGANLWAKVLLAVLVVAQPLVYTIPYVAAVAGPDTREVMQAWVYANIPPGTPIHRNGPYNVPLDDTLYPWTQNYGGDLMTVDAIRATGADYVILSDAWYHNLLRSVESVPAAERAAIEAYLATLAEALTPVAFLPRLALPGDGWLAHSGSYYHNPGLVVYRFSP